MAGSVLIVEDDDVAATSLRLHLERHGWHVRVSGSAEEALGALGRAQPDVVIADYLLPGRNGIDLLRSVRETDPGISVIIVTANRDVQVAVDAIKAGAFDYLTKPVAMAELCRLLDRAVGAGDARPLPARSGPSESGDRGLCRLIGESPAIEAVKETVRRIVETERHLAQGDLPAVLITGETGTGKELVAQALHFDGVRRGGPFVEVNCASIPDTLLEAELFGHERGAFTDAKHSKAGLAEAAEGGTLFLDEIGEVSPAVQVKLLKLLEEKTVRHIGSVHERRVNVRFVSATHQDLDQLVKAGRFRSDLYFRLRTLMLALPPLRNRGRDVLLLARHFLDAHGRRYGKHDLRFSGDAERMLLDYHWPGNVRELRNALEQAVLITRGSVVGAEQIAVSLGRKRAPEQVLAHARGATDMTAPGAPLPRPGSIFDIERDLIVQTLKKTAWNVAKAARMLGISRDRLRKRIERYGLVAPPE